MRILITGGAGFIGSHLCESFLADGHRVTVLDDLSTGRRSNLAGARDLGELELVEADLLDESTVERLVEQADLVVHLAAAVGVRLVLEAPSRTMHVNVEGTRRVLAAAARRKVRCLIASSSEVYGRSTKLPFHEDDSLLLGATSEARWSYACSKAMGEWMALAQFAERGLPVTVVRFFNVVGPRQRGRYGMVLPNFVRQALAGEPITVFGDGCQTRSFLHVHDAVRAVRMLAESDDALGRVFNVGSDRETSIESLARCVRARLASDSPIVHMPYREAYGMAIHDLARRVPDVGRLHALTGFVAERDLECAIDDVAAQRRLLSTP